VRAPRAVGVKVTRIWHFAPAASVFGEIGQVDVSAKSPDVEILLMVSGTVSVLVSTVALDVLVVCTTQLPNPTVAGLKV